MHDTDDRALRPFACPPTPPPYRSSYERLSVDDPGVDPDDARQLARERRGAAIIILAACFITIVIPLAVLAAFALGTGQ